MSNVLEDNLERLIVPPSEIRRAMDYIHSCDLKWQSAMTQWKDRQDKLLAKVKSRIEGKPRDGSVNLKALALPPDDPDVKMVTQLKALVFQLADQKVVAAQCAYDLLDLQIQKLNADASSFEKELKARGELMDTDDHDRGFAMEEDDQAPAAAPTMTASQHQQSLALQQKIQQAQAQIMSQVQQLQQQIAHQSQQESAAASEASSKASSSSNVNASSLLQKSSVAGTIKKTPAITTTPSANLPIHHVSSSQDRTASPSVLTTSTSSLSASNFPMSTIQGSAPHTTPSVNSSGQANQASAPDGYKNITSQQGSNQGGVSQQSTVRPQIPPLPIQQNSAFPAASAGNAQPVSSESPFQQQSDVTMRSAPSSSASSTFTERKPGGGITINEDYMSALSKLPPTPSASSNLSANLASTALRPSSSPPKQPLLQQEQIIQTQTPLNPPLSSQRVSPVIPQPPVTVDVSLGGEKKVQSGTVSETKGGTTSNATTAAAGGGGGGGEEEGDDSQGDGPLYCICKRSAFGDMVACDVPKCPNGEWFHHECVKLNKKSAKKDDIWICPGCKASGSLPASMPAAKKSKRER